MTLGADPLHREHDADDVDDRIERADFVQVDGVDRHLMDSGFNFREPLKHRLRAIASGGRQRGAIDEREDLRKASVRMMPRVRVMMIVRVVTVVMVFVRVIVLVHGELRRRHTGAKDLLCVHVDTTNGVEREAAERARELVERQAGVDERAERHVSGNAGEAIEIQ